MGIVHDIIRAFGDQVKLSTATGIAQQTISEWARRDPPEIPPWRRPAILNAATAAGDKVQLSPEAIAYLASTRRTKKAPASEQAAA